MLKVQKAPQDLGAGASLPPRGLARRSVPHHSPRPEVGGLRPPARPRLTLASADCPKPPLSPRPCLWPEES